MSSTTYLITGANRGIGLGIAQALLERPNTIVIAAVRNPSSASSLTSLTPASSSKLVVVKIDSSEPSTARDAISELQSKHGISSLDVVIANAGVADYYGPLSTAPTDEFQRHYSVNVLGPIALFQETLPLLKKSSQPKFVAVSTAIGSIAEIDNLPMLFAPYGASKAALNWTVRKIHAENPELIAFPISPGWVSTDMGNAGAKAAGLDEAPVKVEDSAKGILNRIDHATREHTSGTFQDFENDQQWRW